MKAIVILAAFCMATIALADPAKPNPPTDYTLSAFAITPNGYVSARTYCDQTNLRFRSDVFDKDFNQMGEFLAFFNTKKGYWYDSASGQCTTVALTTPWVNPWDFLKTATFAGVDQYYTDKQCNLWTTDLGNDMTLASCFTGDSPVFISLINGTQLNSLYFITSFTAGVDSSVFSLPSTCSSSSFKLSASLPKMQSKKFQVPTHPLLF